jgi:hypothetical protein
LAATNWKITVIGGQPVSVLTPKNAIEMGNIASPWHYDNAAYHTIGPENKPPPTI